MCTPSVFGQDKPVKKMMKRLLNMGFVDPDEWYHVQMKWRREAHGVSGTCLFVSLQGSSSRPLSNAKLFVMLQRLAGHWVAFDMIRYTYQSERLQVQDCFRFFVL